VIEINGNVPFFTEADLQADTAFATYSELDSLGRCGPAFGCVGAELQPEGEREPNDHIRPSGMHNTTYEFVDKLFLYNRCHLIAYSIAGSNGDPRNLITGTRYMNTRGMLPYENKVLLYIEETGNHVLYRVSPVFEGENLVASGVLMEAYSLEDHGQGLSFCVYAYNVQPGVRIDYLTGENEADGSLTEESEVSEEDCRYILNTRTQKIHLPDCESVKKISPLNKKPTNESLEDLKKKGYDPCGYCLHGK
jgi:DNA-entry nuclease